MIGSPHWFKRPVSELRHVRVVDCTGRAGGGTDGPLTGGSEDIREDWQWFEEDVSRLREPALLVSKCAGGTCYWCHVRAWVLLVSGYLCLPYFLHSHPY